MDTTARLVEKAETLGYTIIEINPENHRVDIIPTNPNDTPMLSQQRQGWTIQTTSYGQLTTRQASEMVAGYMRAIVMAQTLDDLDYENLTGYKYTR